MKNILKTKADKMFDLYLQIEKQFKWEHNLSNHFAALTYIQKEKEFDKDKIKSVINYIKENTGVFSNYRSNAMYILAMLLCSEYDNPKEKFSTMMIYDKKLKEAGFKSNTYLPIANYALLLTCEENLIDYRVKKAFEIYSEMKKNHPWITSGDDYALSILLAGFNKSVNDIEKYYMSLNNVGFSKGNGLQLLSHILSFSDSNIEIVTRKCRDLYIKLKENKLKIGSDYYASLGLISLLDDDSGTAASDLIELAKYINGLKKYKWLGKGMNVLIASAMVSSEYINERKQNNLIDTTISISIEALIAAQTSAMIAAATASYIAVYSTSSN